MRDGKELYRDGDGMLHTANCSDSALAPPHLIMTAARAKRSPKFLKREQSISTALRRIEWSSCSLHKIFAAEVTHTSRQAAPAHTEMELAFELLPADAVAGTRPKLPMRPSFVVMWRRRCGACSLV